MTTEQIKKIIIKELPLIFEKDPDIQKFIIDISKKQFADKTETESRFDKMLDELRRDREEQSKKWQEHREEDKKEREKQDKKWQEHQEEENKKWEVQEEKWQEQNQKWWENQKTHEKILQKIDIKISAIGARWGTQTESSFRNALKAILEESFGVHVINVNEFDSAGEVFGKPDQVELDIIIKNSMLIVCEIKSSMSKNDMYAFYRKVKFYEKRHKKKTTTMMVISPMVEPKAKITADKYKIKVYSYIDEINPSLLTSKKRKK